MTHKTFIRTIKTLWIAVMAIGFVVSQTNANMTLNGPTTDLRMRCDYTYTLEYDVTSPTLISNFVKLNTEFDANSIDSISWWDWWSNIDTTYSNYQVTNDAGTKKIEVWGILLTPVNNGDIHTLNITTSNQQSASFSIYGRDSDGWLADANSPIWQWPVNYTLDYIDPRPCVDDTTAPVLGHLDPISIDGWIRVYANSGISFDLAERNGVPSAGWISNDYNDTNNYLQHDDLSYNASNQWWVNINSLNMTLSYIGGAGYSYPTYSRNNNNIWNTWDYSGFNRTWQYLYRDYNVQTTNYMQPLGREKAMRLAGSVNDRSWNTRTFTYEFNQPDNPKIKDLDPGNGSNNLLPLNDIIMTVYDNWAWVQEDSIIVRIYNDSNGGELIAEFSGSALNASGVTWIADWPDYAINIYSGTMYNDQRFTFPMPTTDAEWTYTIRVEVTATDYEGNVWTPSYTMNTRPACITYPGCLDALSIENIYVWNGLTGSVQFFDTGLYVTGYNNVTLSGQVLDCGPTNTWVFMGTTINGAVSETFYDQETLYIDGWEIISVQSWVIRIKAN